jgi:hypothetical protein
MTCCSNCSRFPLSSSATAVIPVIVPPGRARLVTSPIATGSTAATNTTGTDRAASLASSTDEVPEATTTSTLRRISSASASGSRPTLPANPQSITTC